MADGTGADPNGTSADQAYKSFSSENEFTTFQSKTFSSGYNDMKSKAISKIGEALGEDVEDLDSALDKVKEYKKKLADQITDPTATDEYKELQNTTNTYKQELEEAKKQVQGIQNQYKFDSTFNETVSQIKEASKFVIPESDVKDLFQSKHKVEYKDGKEVVRQGENPIMDDKGNYKPLSEVFKDFSKKYIEPASKGSGGGGGDGGDVKPKFADFKAANQGKDNAKMKSLLDQAKAAGGWEEPDAPGV